MEKGFVHKYLALGAIIILMLISFLIVKSYIIALIGAFILAYLFRPCSKWLELRTSKSLAAIITIILAILIILLPIGSIVTGLISQTYDAVQSGTVDSLIEKMSKLEIIEKNSFNIKTITNNFLEFGTNSLIAITFSITEFIISLSVLIFAMYYLLTEWNSICAKIKKYIPLEKKERLINNISESTKHIIHGTLLIALIEFIIAAIGFWLAGNSFFFILAAMIAIFTFIPGGPAIIWFPVMIFEIINKNYLDAGIILAFGLILSIYVETIFRAKVIGRNAKIHPLIAILGVLGGTTIFGISGLVIGPLFLSYTLKILEEIIGEN